MRLRDDYVRECRNGIGRWNKLIERAGFEHRLSLPHVAFNRAIGEFASIQATPEGEILGADDWERRRDQYLPTAEDGAFIASLMQPVRAPGAFASWIAPPKAGIDNKPGDFEYVKLE